MKRLMMLVGGGVVGAGLGLLFAPQAGAKSRKKIMRFGRDMSNKSDRLMRDMSDRMSDWGDTMGAMSGKAMKLIRIRH